KNDILHNEKARFDRINKDLANGNKTEPKTIASEIIKYSNLGAFEGSQFNEMMAKKLKVGQLSTEQAAKLIELAKKVEKAPEGSTKNDATED
ncbi:hypothetical protein, partial [Listeria monocytogenes]|uniref:hypothetical protein n=1 Tax=Listeria monocytogenes TaxID=1639 RepID=UPI002FDC1622